MLIGRNKTSLAIFAYLGISLSSVVSDAEETTMIGFIEETCACRDRFAGDEDSETIKRTLQAGAVFGSQCRAEKDWNICYSHHMNWTECPTRCSKLNQQKKLTRDDLAAALSRSEQVGRSDYQKKIPKKIYDRFNEKFGGWWPILVNRVEDPEFVAKYSLHTQIYNFTSLKIDGKTVETGIIYFFKSLGNAISGEWSWTFWDIKSAELIYSGDVPIRMFSEGGYLSNPGLVSSGKDLEEVLIRFDSAGFGDAAACTNLYQLNQLRTNGPVELKWDSIESAQRRVIEKLCYQSWPSPSASGKFAPSFPKLSDRIDLRIAPTASSEKVGVCEAGSPYFKYDEQTNGWREIYCNGQLGWIQSPALKPRSSP